MLLSELVILTRSLRLLLPEYLMCCWKFFVVLHFCLTKISRPYKILMLKINLERSLYNWLISHQKQSREVELFCTFN